MRTNEKYWHNEELTVNEERTEVNQYKLIFSLIFEFYSIHCAIFGMFLISQEMRKLDVLVIK